MRTFKSFNSSGNSICPICGTNEEKETLLIPIQGTQDGKLMEAAQVHSECLENRMRLRIESSRPPLIYAMCDYEHNK